MLCTAECSAGHLVSTHELPVVPYPLFMITKVSADIAECLLVAKSPPVENHWSTPFPVFPALVLKDDYRNLKGIILYLFTLGVQ